jgi:hypothetical protein
VVERAMGIERAVVVERAVGIERAVVVERAVGIERAVAIERAVGIERAVPLVLHEWWLVLHLWWLNLHPHLHLHLHPHLHPHPHPRPHLLLHLPRILPRLPAPLWDWTWAAPPCSSSLVCSTLEALAAVYPGAETAGWLDPTDILAVCIQRMKVTTASQNKPSNAGI